MTKKAAKKKQGNKKAPKKVSTSGPKPSGSNEGADEEGKVDSSESAPSSEKVSKSEPQIEVVQETATEAETGEPKKKMGRVPQPDGGRRRESSRSRSGAGRRGNKRNSGPRPQIDLDELGKKAWKVFQHEIAEEGLALIDEVSARQLAEKSLTVTRSFLEERERRLGKSKSEETKEERPEDKKVDQSAKAEKAVKNSDELTEDLPADLSSEENPTDSED